MDTSIVHQPSSQDTRLAASERVISTQLQAATGAVNASVAAAKQGVDTLAPLLGSTQQAVTQANANAEQIKKAAAGVGGIATALTPTIGNIKSDADVLRGLGDTNRDLAQPWLESSTSLLAMDRNAGGTTGEFLKLYDSLDPQLQVSLAAAGARDEAQSQQESAVRSLTRAGVAPTASAVASLRAKLANNAAAMVAGIKTKAQQAGVQLQMGALEKAVAMAVQQAGMGEQFLRDSAAATQAGAATEKDAGSLQVAQGELLANQGDLEAKAGQLMLSGASTAASVAQAYQRATQDWSNSLQGAAEYYSTQASSLLGLMQRGAGPSSLSRLLTGGTSLSGGLV